MLFFLFLRALPVQAREPRETVDIKDYPADDGIASFKQAFADGQTVVVPPGWVCENINAAINDSGGKNAAGTGRGCVGMAGDGLFCRTGVRWWGAGRQSAQCDAGCSRGRTV
ncbi:Colanic acid biosynthesis protein wcaM [Salmonella enterica subsp. enterica]|uniref:Colanic acid biosynthesis protein wcaM n=1 Tax=Salmonella enterica I TaxID=59201 RepID=A0A3S4ISN4_SALET|nr:Colanic acid biosynthesis protein wcaM [Salmonella enterica subsp. enterica]